MLGRGSFGNVYLAFETSSGIPITIKQIPLAGIPNNVKEQRIKSLLGEIELLSKLSHKNIVKYYGTSKDDNFINIFLEYVGGGSLE